MASWKELIDTKLEKLFNTKPDDGAKVAEKRRKGVLEGIDKALAAIKAGDAKGPRGWYASANNITKCTLRSGTRPVLIDGKDAAYVPAERATDFYTGIRADVEKGEFDKAIAAAWSEKGAAPAAKGTGAGKGATGSRGPMDPAKAYNRTMGRFGQARADELLNAKVDKKEADAIRKRAAELRAA